ncbi:MAG: hypothetical protein LBE27_07785 [Deltaproteobacteria bacterium]|jgi:tetratricopeptide (TPR) repeat protein|nr:hypothetical protein [Deltaproteobacteria bacterium]
MALIFKTTKGPKALGYFEPSNPAAWSQHHKTLDRLFDDLNKHSISNRECMQRCVDILEREPSFLGALTLLLDCLVTENKNLTDDVLDILLNYLTPVQNLIPQNFKEALDANQEENIYFLSSHLYLLYTLLSLERYPEAMEVYHDHQRWQQNHNVTAIVGNIHIITGELDKAERVFTSYPVPMPSESYYSLGLIKFLKGDLEASVKILREAIILQPYVPEIILNPTATVNYGWHYPNQEGLFYHAQIYCGNFLGTKIWGEDVESLSFLEWVYTCPDMLAERAKGLSILNRILYLDPSKLEEKEQLHQDFLAFAKRPNPALIRRILKKVPHEKGPINPWELYFFSDTVNSLVNETLDGVLSQVDSGVEATMSDLREAGEFLNTLDEYADCGDCEKCEIFDECSSSPAIDVESCHECDECEIKDFCHAEEEMPQDSEHKKPPVRH